MYNSRVVPRQVHALLARKSASNNVKCQNVKSRTIWGSVNSAHVISRNCESNIEKCNSKIVHSVVENDPTVEGSDENVSPVVPTGGGRRCDQADTAKIISRPHMPDHTQSESDPDSETRTSVTADIENGMDSGEVLIYNVNSVDDKFASSVLHAAQFKKVGVGNLILFVCLFGVLRPFQHCTGHITTGSWKGRGNQYI